MLIAATMAPRWSYTGAATQRTSRFDSQSSIAKPARRTAGPAAAEAARHLVVRQPGQERLADPGAVRGQPAPDRRDHPDGVDAVHLGQVHDLDPVQRGQVHGLAAGRGDPLRRSLALAREV